MSILDVSDIQIEYVSVSQLRVIMYSFIYFSGFGLYSTLTDIMTKRRERSIDTKLAALGPGRCTCFQSTARIKYVVAIFFFCCRMVRCRRSLLRQTSEQKRGHPWVERWRVILNQGQHKFLFTRKEFATYGTKKVLRNQITTIPTIPAGQGRRDEGQWGPRDEFNLQKCGMVKMHRNSVMLLSLRTRVAYLDLNKKIKQKTIESFVVKISFYAMLMLTLALLFGTMKSNWMSE